MATHRVLMPAMLAGQPPPAPEETPGAQAAARNSGVGVVGGRLSAVRNSSVEVRASLFTSFEALLEAHRAIVKENRDLRLKLVSLEAAQEAAAGGAPAKAEAPKAAPHVYIEMAASFSPEKFSSTLAAVRRTSVPPSHLLCFYYTSLETAEKALGVGGFLTPCSRCGGVPLSLRGPGEMSQLFSLKQDSNENFSVERGEVCIALVIPRRLLWGFPVHPGVPPALDADCRGPFRVLPSKLLVAISGQPNLTARRAVKRAYQLTDCSGGGLSEASAGSANEDGSDSSDDERALKSAASLSPAAKFPKWRQKDLIKDLRTPSNDQATSARLSAQLPSLPPRVRSPSTFEEYLDTVDVIRKECAASGTLMLYHYTDPCHAKAILENGLLMSTQGQGDGGVYFSLHGPASYGYGLDNERGASYEENLITDCFGASRLVEYLGTTKLDLILVCSVEEGLVAAAPGRENALMVPKELFECMGVPAADGRYYLPPACIKAALVVTTRSCLVMPPGNRSLIVSAEAARDDLVQERARWALRKLRAHCGNNDLAPLPLELPGLPTTFLPRPDISDRMKASIIPMSTNTTTLQQHRRCVLQGMGGCGKTTILAALLLDTEVRSAFMKVAWLTIGQNPDVPVLQESLHVQLSGLPMPPHIGLLASDAISVARRAALAAAGRNTRVLLVLDDVWDQANEAEFTTCLDFGAGSRVLTSTRIKGLFKEGAHVINASVLTEAEAVSLLLGIAGIQESDLHEGCIELVRAKEVSELMGRLPLALTMAAGLIEANGHEISAELISTLKHDLSFRSSRGLSSPFVVEDRVIVSTLTMMLRGANPQLALACFSLFGVFPDGPVPACIFDTLAPILADTPWETSLAAIVIREIAVPMDQRQPEESNYTLLVDQGSYATESFVMKHGSYTVLCAPKKASRAGAVDARTKTLTETVQTASTDDPRASPRTSDNWGTMTTSLTSSQSRRRKVLAVRGCLSELLRFNLLCGSFSDASGLSVHDVVRSYLVSQFHKREMQESRLRLATALVATRSQVSVESPFTPSTPSKRGLALSEYLQRNLHHHFRGALVGCDNSLPEAWARHADPVVQTAVALALGVARIDAWSRELEQQGRLVDAAHVAFLGLRLKGRTGQDAVTAVGGTDLFCFRAAQYLERADDSGAAEFEWNVLQRAMVLRVGSAFQRATLERQRTLLFRFKVDKELFGAFPSSSLLYSIALSEALLLLEKSHAAVLSLPPPISAPNLSSAVDWAAAAIAVASRAAALAPSKQLRSYLEHLLPSSSLGWLCTVCAHMEEWSDRVGTVSNLRLGLEEYTLMEGGLAFKESGTGVDYFLQGCFVPVLGFYFGDLPVLDLWCKKALAAFVDEGFGASHPVSGSFDRLFLEVYANLLCVVPTVLATNGEADARAFLEAFGFSWDNFDESFERFWASPSNFNKREGEAVATLVRLLLFLSSPLRTSDLKAGGASFIDEGSVNAWLPSPASLALLDRESSAMAVVGSCSLLSLGAQAFVRLGRLDDATEAARLGHCPQQGTRKTNALVDLHVVLGRVSHLRGKPDNAKGHFTAALELARKSKLPMLEVIVTRQWGQARIKARLSERMQQPLP